MQVAVHLKFVLFDVLVGLEWWLPCVLPTIGITWLLNYLGRNLKKSNALKALPVYIVSVYIVAIICTNLAWLLLTLMAPASVDSPYDGRRNPEFGYPHIALNDLKYYKHSWCDAKKVLITPLDKKCEDKTYSFMCSVPEYLGKGYVDSISCDGRPATWCWRWWSGTQWYYRNTSTPQAKRGVGLDLFPSPKPIENPTYEWEYGSTKLHRRPRHVFRSPPV
jgi:hypothetical protein